MVWIRINNVSLLDIGFIFTYFYNLMAQSVRQGSKARSFLPVYGHQGDNKVARLINEAAITSFRSVSFVGTSEYIFCATEERMDLLESIWRGCLI